MTGILQSLKGAITKTMKKGPEPGAFCALEARLGHCFGDGRLLEQALCHRSFANEHSGAGRVSNERLGIAIELPTDWSGTSDEGGGIVKLQSSDRISISIGRDPKTLEPRKVFDAMKAEGWTVVATNQSRQIPGTSRSVAVADMTRGERRLRLYLLDQADGATIVVYAVHDGKLKPEQWTPVTQVVGQIAVQTDSPASTTPGNKP